MDSREFVAAGGLAQPTIGMALVRLLLSGTLLFILLGLLGAVVNPETARAVSPIALAAQLALCVVMVFAYQGTVRLIEQRSASELTWRSSIPWILAGALLGAGVFCAVYAVLWLAGVVSTVQVRGFDGVLLVFVISVAAGVGEEIFFRGVLYRIVENAFGTMVALVVSSALFGFAHAANPNATLFSNVAIAIEAGLLLGLAYSATRSLWFPIGVHFAWNFTQTGIFGAPLSGYRFDGLLNVPLSGPDILTGGAFGPEASIVTVIVCLIVSAILGWATVCAGRWRALKSSTRKAEP